MTAPQAATELPGAEHDAECARLAAVAYANVHPTTPDLAMRSFQDLRDTTGLHRLGFGDDGELLGFVAATLTGEPHDESSHGWQIWWLAVAPSHRRQGIGRHLLRALQHRAEREGVDHLWCWTWDRASEAVAFYEGTGWAQTRRVVIELEGDARGPLEVRRVYQREVGDTR